MTLRVVTDGPGDDPRPVGRAASPRLPADPETAAELVALMTRVAEGDQDAFSALYERTVRRVHGVVWRVLRSADHAAEVTQEVYVEVWRQAARYDASRGSVSAWMTTMAHRRAVDRVRSVTSETARIEHYSVREVGRDVDHVWEDVEQRVEADRVRQGLRSLSALQREVLTLAYFGGYTQNQIAALLQVPLGTVKTRVRDALIKLKAALDEEPEGKESR
ncbi:RNA polymerase sigma-70 factor, ECF subfamily [Microlunatus sagamiharensis]|uniref:RNA polymerase sigma-70 factor, ECF subfamily n=1 Tax=Microlunatus sagamiharensis TaxID=546874 RepID=A0A1H2MBT3_9ACTN|nr:ECF RNA polymerase sigma factor SigK [Microlunatus sagamiharensis]SDU90534.1 RNA polymerase sigma-70 factor, ECF subfamily [Microlunatus sagamiharensis]